MKRLVLVGGGHSHVAVLDAMARERWEGVEAVLVSPSPRQIYSGMLPGWIAGHYTLAECTLPLDRLAERAGCRLVQGACAGLDPDSRRVLLDDGSCLDFDLASFNTGPAMDASRLPGADRHAVPLRPFEDFAAAWQTALAAAHGRRHVAATVVGGGAGGVETALAIQHRLASDPLIGDRFLLHLVSATQQLLPEHPRPVGDRLARLLRERGIDLRLGSRAVGFGPAEIRLDSDEALPSDFTVLAVGAQAPRWPHDSGLATDEDGFVLVNACLQSVSHPQVFAAGDLASMQDEPRPKSGVYAVRAGPRLARNLRRALAGQPLRAYVPQRIALYLISTGERHAIASWNGLWWSGRWVWRWKDRIDRAFMARYQ